MPSCHFRENANVSRANNILKIGFIVYLAIFSYVLACSLQL